MLEIISINATSKIIRYTKRSEEKVMTELSTLEKGGFDVSRVSLELVTQKRWHEIKKESAKYAKKYMLEMKEYQAKQEKLRLKKERDERREARIQKKKLIEFRKRSRIVAKRLKRQSEKAKPVFSPVIQDEYKRVAWYFQCYQFKTSSDLHNAIKKNLPKDLRRWKFEIKKKKIEWTENKRCFDGKRHLRKTDAGYFIVSFNYSPRVIDLFQGLKMYPMRAIGGERFIPAENAAVLERR